MTSPVTTFQTQFCNDMTPIMSTASCQSDVLIEVQTFSSFGGVSFTPCNYNSNATGTGTMCQFSGGSGGSIVGVRVTYNRPFLLGWVGACLSGGSCWTGIGSTPGSNPGTGKTALVATVIFQNEPFS